jgi:hypothetical protein
MATIVARRSESVVDGTLADGVAVVFAAVLAGAGELSANASRNGVA